MWRAFCLFAFFVLGWAGSASAGESLYLTTTAPIRTARYGSSEDGYTFIAPYFARVQTRISFSIVPGSSKSDGSPAGPPTVTIAVNPVPATRGYLYLIRNAFFSDSINVGVGNDGMLTSSDSASAQQITAILNELAATLGTGMLLKAEKPAAPPSDREKCKAAITSLVSNNPYYANAPLFENIPFSGFVYPVDISPAGGSDKIELSLSVKPLVPSSGQVRINGQHPGLVAFFPVPATVILYCVANQTKIALTAPSTFNLYTESHFLDPQRDFLTGPQETLTFSSGFIAGHKYTDQSPAKTIVDTVTGPIRSILPSVTVTQSVAVSPTGKTTTTSTQTGPPKGP